jgi:cell division protein FtsB
MRKNQKGEGEVAVISGVAFICLLIVGLITLGMWGCPQYNVYEQRLVGEAELAKASQNRQIRVQEAMAKKEAAKLEGEAEVARAEGLAKANRTLGESLTGEHGEKYLRYLWITGMEKSQHDTIYIPTEAGLPIMESTRRLKIPSPPVEK